MEETFPHTIINYGLNDDINMTASMLNAFSIERRAIPHGGPFICFKFQKGVGSEIKFSYVSGWNV